MISRALALWLAGGIVVALVFSMLGWAGAVMQGWRESARARIGEQP